MMLILIARPFPSFALFNNTNFIASASFNNAIFLGEANFNNAFFLDVADFHKTTFLDSSHFSNVIFSNFSYFDKTIFSSVAYFSNVTFSNATSFSNATFLSTVHFTKTIFEASSALSRCIFMAPVLFRDVTAEKAFDFSGSLFMQKSDFAGTKFGGAVIFNHCHFGNIDGYKFFVRLSDEVNKKMNSNNFAAIDEVLPDFTSTIFTIPPNLSFVSLPDMKKRTDKMAAAKTRRLKQLAKEGENHIAEGHFFRLEMLARRGTEVFGIMAIMITLYNFISLCGLSLWRPLVGLLFLTLTCSCTYLFYEFLGLKSIYGGSYFEYLIYSFHNAIPIFGATVPEKTAIINALFGGYDTRPWYFGTFAVVQNILSVFFEFLMLLAVRNYFKMK